MTLHGRAALLACIASLGPLAGCTTGEGGTGTVGIAVTDAPEDDWSAVEVTFSSAQIHQAGDDDDDEAGDEDDADEAGDTDDAGNGDENATAEADDADDEGDWIEIVNRTRTVDLMALHANGTAAALGFAEVDAGHYTQVRLTVDSVVGTRKDDGSEVTMTVPSGVLRTSRSFNVEDGGNTTITLEIDLARSIHCTPQGCNFTPVLGKVEVTEA